jgi:hypothetical protein
MVNRHYGISDPKFSKYIKAAATTSWTSVCAYYEGTIEELLGNLQQGDRGFLSR